MASDTAGPLPEQFRAACEPLFAASAGHGEQRAAAHRLFDLLSGIVGYDDNAPTEGQARDSFLAGGKAIAFQGAARCLWEYLRTSRFLRGVELALRQAQGRFPGQRLRLLEAGCGPFALLALPLATRFGPDEVGFTLLDIHAESLAAARSIVATLGLEAHVDAYVQADAATWRCPESSRPHVVVSETMQNGLKKEPQVAITRNLAPQRLAGGYFLPEVVELDLALLVSRRGDDGIAMPEAHRVARLMRLTPDSVADEFSGTVALPAQLPERGDPVVTTRIGVFGDILLDDNECSLTLPLRIKGLPKLAPGDRLHYDYPQSGEPGLRFSVPPRANG